MARGEKTILRKFERSDVDRWLAWPRHLDALLASYNPPWLTPSQRDTYFRAREGDAHLMQYAVDDLDGRMVGRISLREIDWFSRSSVLGLTFHPGRLGEGLGTDALQALLVHYFGPLGMRIAFLDVAAFNRRALRCYEKCGFRVCGHRWGEALPDYAVALRRPEHAGLRTLFRERYGEVAPLLIDMALRRGEFFRARVVPTRDRTPARAAGVP